jgi:dTDP-4-dehydrorhamnose reductase
LKTLTLLVLQAIVSIEHNSSLGSSILVDKLSLVKCDLTDQGRVSKLLESYPEVDVIVNTAALSQPGACESNPEAARHDYNLTTTLLPQR